MGPNGAIVMELNTAPDDFYRYKMRLFYIWLRVNIKPHYSGAQFRHWSHDSSGHQYCIQFIGEPVPHV